MVGLRGGGWGGSSGNLLVLVVWCGVRFFAVVVIFVLQKQGGRRQ